MKVGIFYISLRPGGRRRPLPIPGMMTNVYIRIEVVEALDLVEALDSAQPEPGESVMNTHRLTED